MYELLFRSRWYAFAWSLFMAASAIMFTTTGAGAWLTGPDAHASREARESQFRAWAEDDNRRLGEEPGTDPSNPDRLRDGRPQQDAVSDEGRRTVPFSPDDSDDETADDPVNQQSSL